MNVFPEDLEKVLLAALLGAVLGLERQWSGKSAGLRTLMLVSMGAALFTTTSYQMAAMVPGNMGEFTRIASNIVVGIGFLGAGLIFKSEQNVHGLTTAATVWSAAAIGLTAGIGNYRLAIGTTVTVWAILVVLHFIEYLLDSKWQTRDYIIKQLYTPRTGLLAHTSYFTHGYTLLKSKTEKGHGEATHTWKIRASHKLHEEAVQRMLQDERVTKVDY